MQRRECLSGLCVVLSASISGCSGGGSETSSGGSEINSGTSNIKSPKDVTRSYLTAYYSGDYQEALSYTTGVKREKISKQAVAETAAMDPVLEEILASNKSDTEAAVSYVSSVETPYGTHVQTSSALLIKSNGEWLVTRVRSDDGEATPDEASAYDGVDDGGPADIVRSFLKSYFNSDYNATISNSTPEFEESINKYDILAETEFKQTSINSIEKSDTEAEVEADVIIIGVTGDEVDQSITLYLKRIQDKWLVNEMEVSYS